MGASENDPPQIHPFPLIVHTPKPRIRNMAGICRLSYIWGICYEVLGGVSYQGEGVNMEAHRRSYIEDSSPIMGPSLLPMLTCRSVCAPQGEAQTILRTWQNLNFYMQKAWGCVVAAPWLKLLRAEVAMVSSGLLNVLLIACCLESPPALRSSSGGWLGSQSQNDSATIVAYLEAAAV